MIITSFIVLLDENIKYFEQIAANNTAHLFPILSIENHREQRDMKIVTFSFDSNCTNMLLLDLFYLGKKTGREQFKTLSNETAY